MFNRIVGNLVTSKTIPQGAATTVYACVCPGIGTDGVSAFYVSKLLLQMVAVGLCENYIMTHRLCTVLSAEL